MSERNEGRYVHQRVSPAQYVENRAANVPRIPVIKTSIDEGAEAVERLAGIFTSLMESFDTKLTNQNVKGLTIPELDGDEPKSLPYLQALRVNPFTTATEEQFHEFESCVYANEKRMEIISPIGNYGEAFSHAVVNATRACFTLVRHLMQDESAIEKNRHFELIQDETFWNDPLRTLCEGFQTTAATFSVLASEKVRGYEDDPVALYQELVRKDLFREVSMISPQGVLFPLVRSGLGFHAPLQIGGDGVELSPHVDNMLRYEKKYGNHPRQSIQWGMRCPASRENVPILTETGEMITIPDSGVTIATRIFGQYFEHYYTNA